MAVYVAGSYDLEPHALQNAKIPNSLKRSVMDTARAWPLYFCKLFPVVVNSITIN